MLVYKPGKLGHVGSYAHSLACVALRAWATTHWDEDWQSLPAPWKPCSLLSRPAANCIRIQPFLQSTGSLFVEGTSEPKEETYHS